MEIYLLNKQPVQPYFQLDAVQGRVSNAMHGGTCSPMVSNFIARLERRWRNVISSE